jgi:hypothetical protein
MSNVKILDDFIADFGLNRTNGISIVSSKDLSQLKSAGCSAEDLFNHLSTQYNSLLHGSRTEIFQEYLIPNAAGEVFATDLASIALMKSIISNSGLIYPGIQYPYFINEEDPLIVSITGLNENTIGQSGFVYILNQREGFENDPKGSWQYVNRGRIPINAKIAVEKTDFTYPIFDVTHNKRIQ